MANPNIVDVSTILGKTAVQNVANVMTAVVTNSAASNTIIKVNSLHVSNMNSGNNNGNVSAELFRSSNSYSIASEINVPDAATLVLISKDSSIYLEEGDSLRLKANDNDFLQAVCSYEEIS